MPLRPSLVGLLLCSLLANPLHADLLYSVTELGDFSPYSINERGEVVGEEYYWSPDDGLIKIGNSLIAYQINDNGIVVGVGGFDAFKWSKSTGKQDLEVPFGLFGISGAYGINELNEIVGEIHMASPDGGGEVVKRGFIWREDGSLQFLTNDEFFKPFNINNSSVVTGAIEANDTQQAAFWSEETGLVPLTTPTAPYNFTNRINEDGFIAGFLIDTSFLWSSSDGITFPFPDTFVHLDMNESRQLVGYLDEDAYLWSQELGGLNLNDLLDESGEGWQLTYAHSINDLGQIVGWGTNPLGQQRGFLLNPVVVPEASTLLLTTFGLAAGIHGMRQRKRRGQGT